MDLKIGQHLYTRDGRKIGNAIVASVMSHEKSGTIFGIETDFGNTAMFTGEEIEKAFFTSNANVICVTPVAEWRRDSADLKLLRKTE